LIGLSAFNATQRTKEIGVRKVLGANVPDIILLLSRNSLGLVVLSSLLMAPASWWAVSAWLETFVYRAPIDYSVYLIVTLFALGFVGITISFQSLKTALANPVKSLKYE
jgi:putative ABC transport system permease protein